ncbi:MAG: porin family protein [Gemmatimonadetes bacterium]|nr:porin family protein [Gemmatimonadota bacterium]
MPRTLRVPSSFKALFLLVAFAHAVESSPVAAQSGSGQANSNWEINLHAAAMRPGLFEDSSETLQFGGRLLRNFGNGISLGGSVDWASPKDVSVGPFAGLNASLLFYSAGLDYRFRVSPRTVFFLGGGVGAATLKFDEALSGMQETSTGLLFPIGGGFKIHSRPESPSWAFRVDVRDNLILLDTATDDGEVETEPRNNLELSVGLSFLLGNKRQPRIVDVDTDRDGVPDARVRCLDRPGADDAEVCRPPLPAAEPALDPAPEAVEPEVQPERAEPEPPEEAEPRPTERMEPPEDPAAPERAEAAVPGDGDEDGVPDGQDACPGTPSGIPVDDEGCLARPTPPPETPEPAEDVERPVELPAGEQAPAVAPQDLDVMAVCEGPQEWFVEDQIIEYDGRTFEPIDSPKRVDRRFLVRVGAYENVPIYVSDAAEPPYTDFWIPDCGSDDLFKLYVETGSLPWNR